MTDIDKELIAQRKQLAGKYATRHGLDLALVCAVAHHESCGWNPWASRYEPEFERRYIDTLVKRGIVKTPTEAKDRSTSFGLMQIMGQTAREFGFTGRFLSELCNPDIGLDFGCRKLKRCLDLANGDVHAALLKYNGGSDPDYPDKVLAWLPAYSSRE